MNTGHSKTIEFIEKLESLIPDINSENILTDGLEEYNEIAYLERIIKEAREYLHYNEWLIALENTLDNLCEVNYKLDEDILTSAREALQSVYKKTNRPDLIKFLSK